MTWTGKFTVTEVIPAPEDASLIRVVGRAHADEIDGNGISRVTSNTEGSLRQVMVTFFCDDDPGLREGDIFYASGSFIVNPDAPPLVVPEPGTVLHDDAVLDDAESTSPDPDQASTKAQTVTTSYPAGDPQNAG